MAAQQLPPVTLTRINNHIIKRPTEPMELNNVEEKRHCMEVRLVAGAV